MQSYTFRIPFPPSMNHYWRRAGHLMHISGPGKVFASEVRADIDRQIIAWEPIVERVAVSLELTPPCRRKRDIDNYVKSTLDAICKAGLLVNDEQIDMLIVKRLPVEAPGCCDVTITLIQQEETK